MNLRKLISGIILSLFLASACWATGTWQPKGFGYAPGQTAEGSTNNVNTALSQARIDARLGKQIWMADPNYASTLASCVAAIGSNTATLHYSAPFSIASNLTIPANITLAP